MKKAMYHRFIILFLVMTSVGCSGVSSRHRELVSTRAPATRLTMLDGTYLPLAAYRGRTVVLAFWATWCHTAAPGIRRLHDLAGRYHPDSLAIIAVSLDKPDDFEKLRDRVVHQNLNGIQHAFSGNEGMDEAFVALRGTDLPYFVVIDPLGTIRLVTDDDAEVANYLDNASQQSAGPRKNTLIDAIKLEPTSRR